MTDGIKFLAEHEANKMDPEILVTSRSSGSATSVLSFSSVDLCT